MILKGGDTMKNFDDFVKHINSKSDDNIHEKAAKLFEVELKSAESKFGTSNDTALTFAITHVLKEFSLDLLEKYHEWIHE